MELRDLITYYLLKTIKELGISPALLFRRMTEVLSKDINKIEKVLQIKEFSKNDFNTLIHELSDFFIRENLADKIDIEIKQNEILMNVYGCHYLYMSDKSINRDEKCPVCIIALVASIAQTIIKDIEFNTVDYNPDYKNRKCTIKVSFIRH